MNILYLGVARIPDKCPIADYAAVDSKEHPKLIFTQKFDKLLNCFHPHKRPRLTITDKDVGHIHYNSDGNILLAVICSAEYPQSSAFKLMAETRAALQREFSNEIKTATAYALSKQAKPVLKGLVNKFQDPERVDKLAKVVVQVEQVKNAMQQNIQAALKNQDNLDTLLSSSDNMRNEATVFNRSTHRVKEKMQWKNAKMWLWIIVLVICLAAVAIVPIVLQKRKENKS